jgi:small subunit ribosomal protein S7
MVAGKKSTARTISYRALDLFAKKVKAEDPIEAFEQAIQNTKPTLEVKSRRIGGTNYQVPVEVSSDRGESMAMKWIIGFARAKAGRSMIEGLSQELADCFNNQGSSIKKKDDTHKTAEANKAFAHYK